MFITHHSTDKGAERLCATILNSLNYSFYPIMVEPDIRLRINGYIRGGGGAAWDKIVAIYLTLAKWLADIKYPAQPNYK